ncbi:MAG TPA: CapA family protein [Allosphingosinicella sp.]
MLVGAAALALGALATPFLLGGGEDAKRPPGYRLLLAGDVHHGDNYRSSGAPLVAEKGYDFSFEQLRPLIGRADFAMANLETPATDRTVSPISKHFLHRTSFTQAAPALARAGIDAVGLANNHSMDYGLGGLADTFQALAAAKVGAFGAGANLPAAQQPLLLTIPGEGAAIRHVAVFPMFEYRPEFDGALSYYATASRPGLASIDPKRFAEQIRRLRARFPDLFVIASAHWGRNYAWRTPQQAQLGHALVEAGADLVVGHHGHNFQEVERYRGKWILYGIGNFMFNSRGRFNEFGTLPPYGLGVELDFPKSAEGRPLARLYPVLVDTARTGYQPRIPTPVEAKQALLKLLDRSELSPNRRGVALDQDELGVHLRLSL